MFRDSGISGLISRVKLNSYKVELIQDKLITMGKEEPGNLAPPGCGECYWACWSAIWAKCLRMIDLASVATGKHSLFAMSLSGFACSSEMDSINFNCAIDYLPFSSVLSQSCR